MEKIKVSDNGFGMSRANAEKCFLKHATSKILNKEDLFSIKTLGFRGEALPSIAAVSRVKLVTKEWNSVLGYEIINDCGTIKSKGEVGAPDGTSVEVSHLFYNTPARLKFMKSEQTEAGVINSLIEKLALSHPDISFRFSANGKIKLFTPGTGKISDAIYAIYGNDFASRLLQVNYAGDNVKVKGYIGKPLLNKPNRNFQVFFVNGRLVKSRVLQQALEQSYKNAMLVGRYPCCILFITIPYAEVDINVHPSKTEIKFADDTYISNHVSRAISISLKEDIGIFRVEDKTPKNDNQTESKQVEAAKEAEPLLITAEDLSRREDEDVIIIKEPIEETYNRLTEKNFGEGISSFEEKQEVTNVGKWKIFHDGDPSRNKLSVTIDDDEISSGLMTLSSGGVELQDSNQVITPIKTEIENSICEEIPQESSSQESNNQDTVSEEVLLTELPSEDNKTEEKTPEQTIQTEIIPERGEEFRIVGEIFKTYILIEKDKELQLIDKHALHERMIFEQLKTEKGVSSQILLTPYICNLGPSENDIIDSNKEELRTLGFDIEALGSVLIIREIPDIVNIEDVEYILSKTVNFLKINGRITEEVFDELLYIVACKAAIKSGYNTTAAEIEALIREYLNNKANLRYCPHGRPIAISFTQTFIEKQFKRIV
ncbi:MAG: hypothetical protein IJE40_06630 [Clostridia bacterium]|nr:hypothetical protein [Clostridia bacterium]